MTVGRVVNLFAAACVLGAAVAGCSTKKDTPPTTGESVTHGGLAECLRSHGVGDSGGQAVALGPPAGVDPGTWDQAMKACSALAPGPAAP
ncbi:MAG: hypothetical protein WCH82_12370 [Mycobacteriaceae bacterium]